MVRSFFCVIGLAFVSGILTHCSITDGGFSCDTTLTVTGTHGPVSMKACTEYTGLTADQVNFYEKQCQTSNPGGVNMSGTWSKQPCPKTNIVGSCKVGSGSFNFTQWYDKSFAKESAQSGCKLLNGTWSDP